MSDFDKPTEITSIEHIQRLAGKSPDWREFGEVVVREQGDLMIFNYTAQAHYKGVWNYFERVSRGLIVNRKTGEIVARPFDKFFDWGERDRYTSSRIKTVTEKMDGSLGILYRYGEEFRIATRGSFDGEQAAWATEFLQNNYDLTGFLDDITLLFEIIYPQNRIVIDYQGREDLALLGVRNRFTGEYYPRSAVENIANTFGFSLPDTHLFETPGQIVVAAETLDPDAEGWVVEFEDGQRFKFKGEEYRKLHRLIHTLSFKNTLECMASDSLDELRAVVPHEFFGEVNGWVAEINKTLVGIINQTEQAFADAPKDDRKTFALWVMENHKPLASYLFAMLDGKPVRPLIYKMAFRDRGEE